MKQTNKPKTKTPPPSPTTTPTPPPTDNHRPPPSTTQPSPVEQEGDPSPDVPVVAGQLGWQEVADGFPGVGHPGVEPRAPGVDLEGRQHQLPVLLSLGHALAALRRHTW